MKKQPTVIANNVVHRRLTNDTTNQTKGREREDFDEEVSRALEDAGTQLVLCVGYMRILSSAFCHRWAGRCLNVHPSLLPDFAGGMDLQV